MNIKTKSVLKYLLLPDILPQLKELLTSGFGYISYFIALVFGSIRLLPQGHAYLNAANVGHYTIGAVILEAWRKLVFDRKHADQVTLFALVLMGLALFVAQFAILGFSLFTQFANASSYTGIFTTPNPTNDIAHILMDRVFGIPGMFNSCVSLGQVCLQGTVAEGTFPSMYHVGLHSMLQFYSIGLSVIGLVIFLYYVVVVVVETAQTGTPFGRRYKQVWVPIRMIVALGLLLPVGYGGLNSAQLITLTVAKWGSGLATNGWTYFVHTLTASSAYNIYGTSRDNMLATPNKPDIATIPQFYTVLAVCKKVYQMKQGIDDIDAYLVRTGGDSNITRKLADTDYQEALDFFNGGSIQVVFGQKNELWNKHPGAVRPFCGTIILQTQDTTSPGALSLQGSYYEGFIRMMWDNIANQTEITAGVPNLPSPNDRAQDFFYNAADRILDSTSGSEGYLHAMKPSQVSKQAIKMRLEMLAMDSIQQAVRVHLSTTNWQNQLGDIGWGGAGIWYNKIAEMNGSIISAAATLPQVKAWPELMELVAKAKLESETVVSPNERYNPYFSSPKQDMAQILPSGESIPIAQKLNEAYRLWTVDLNSETRDDGTSMPRPMAQNAFTAAVDVALGTEGLFNMYENTDIHPLAQIVTIGKYLMDTAIRNVMVGAGFMVLEKATAGRSKAGVEMISKMALTLAKLTISIGFILYYVVPFLPFIYFFFQVGGWIKALFEAMVGLPLWALAHIRIDGEGLAGSAATSGYFLILELFLRPILLVFGLIGGITIFAAQVQILNDVFELVVVNLTGNNSDYAKVNNVETIAQMRENVDVFFYTIIYAIVVYLMGMASFKLIYLIPRSMLRWIGSSVDAFGDEANAEQLVSMMYIGTKQAQDQVGAAASGILGRK